MKKYLVDTTVFIDHLRNKGWATKFLRQEGLTISIVSIVELLQGARNKKEQAIIQKLIDQFEIDWGNSQINRLAVKLLKLYFLKHNLTFLDALIGATALERKLILATDNIKHFQFINGLKIISSQEIKLLRK